MCAAEMSWEVMEVILSGPGSRWKLQIQYLDLSGKTAYEGMICYTR